MKDLKKDSEKDKIKKYRIWAITNIIIYTIISIILFILSIIGSFLGAIGEGMLYLLKLFPATVILSIVIFNIIFGINAILFLVKISSELK